MTLPRHITLENERVIMRTVQESDREDLRVLARDASIWTHFTTRVEDDASFDLFFAKKIEDQQNGKRLVFTVIDKATGALAGSMSIGNMDLPHKRAEIGWSWLGTPFQGKGINSKAKYELLKYGFESMGLLRMEFKTDFRNIRARKALAKIGGTEEGVFRSYNYMPDGSRRNAVFFSVIAEDWPAVKLKHEQMSRPSGSP